MNRPVYLDYAASAPMRPEAKKAVRKAEAVFGNPASIHWFGQKALEMLDEAKAQIAKELNCDSKELVVTSGGTEADNLAIKGLAEASPRGHIIASAIEHPAVLASCRALEAEGYAVSYVRPDKNGVISKEAIANVIRDNTVLVSVMCVNNETGVIQPIEQISQLIAEQNRERKRLIRFHTDAVQAAPYLHLDVKKLGVDLMTISGHKLGGPKGVGILYVKTGVALAAQIQGGEQEHGLRSGTTNTVGVVGLAAALLATAKNRARENTKLTRWQNLIVDKLSHHTKLVWNGNPNYRVPGILNFSFPSKTSDELVIGMDLNGIAVSAASACSSGSLDPSHVLIAMDKPIEVARSSLRVSMGHATKSRDISRFISSLNNMLESR